MHSIGVWVVFMVWVVTAYVYMNYLFGNFEKEEEKTLLDLLQRIIRKKWPL